MGFQKLQWSGAEAPPKVGEQIVIGINNVGPAIVTGYAEQDGWLGVMAYPLDPPAWWVAANGKPGPGNAGLVFGSEIRYERKEG